MTLRWPSKAGNFKPPAPAPAKKLNLPNARKKLDLGVDFGESKADKELKELFKDTPHTRHKVLDILNSLVENGTVSELYESAEQEVKKDVAHGRQVGLVDKAKLLIPAGAVLSGIYNSEIFAAVRKDRMNKGGGQQFHNMSYTAFVDTISLVVSEVTELYLIAFQTQRTKEEQEQESDMKTPPPKHSLTSMFFKSVASPAVTRAKSKTDWNAQPHSSSFITFKPCERGECSIICQNLQVPFLGGPPYSGKGKVLDHGVPPTLHTGMIPVQSIRPNGNCLFGAIDYAVCGDQSQHPHFRQFCVDMGLSELHTFQWNGRTVPPEEYFHHSRMDQLTTLGTEQKIHCLAKVLKRDIVVYYCDKWLTYPASRLGVPIASKTYLINTGNHFEVVLS